MNLEITIRVPIASGDAEDVTIATNEPAEGDRVTLPIGGDAHGSVGTTNGEASGPPGPPSLEELGVTAAPGPVATTPGPPDVSSLGAPTAAPTVEHGPPPLAELLAGAEAVSPPSIAPNGSLAGVAAVPGPDGGVHRPPSLEELEGTDDTDTDG